MFGYFLLALLVSVFFGFCFFLVVGQPSGIGVSALLILLVGGAIWHIKVNKKRNSLVLIREDYRLFLIEV
jgi:hypothetical protein